MRLPARHWQARLLKLPSWLLSAGVTATDRRRIIRGTLHSFLIQGISIGLVFGSNLWLVRSSNGQAYGDYVHVFNWVSILSVLVMGGRDDLVIAQLPKYLGAGRHGQLVRLIKKANGFIFLSFLVICGAFLILISVFPIQSLSQHRQLFLVAMAAVYFSASLTLNQMILQALNHVKSSQIVEKIVRPLLLVLFTALFLISATTFDGHALVVLGTIASGICCLFILVMVFRRANKLPVVAEENLTNEKHTAKTFYFFVISLLYLLSTKITMLILPLFNPESAIGIFNISYRFADLLIFPFFLMHAVLPQLFARHDMGEAAYTRSLFRESNKLMALLALPLLLLNILAGPFLLRLFGPAFQTGYTALVYISLAQFLFSIFGPTNTILMTQGRERYSAICLLVYVILLGVTSFLLIPVSGITGGALAILLSSAGYNILLAIVVYRLYGICSPFFSFFFR
jgi:O-antigen/teichoic acid export membrane protein